jgi:hypothetical protein
VIRIAPPTFGEVIFPDRWKVGYLRLQPFSLGHAVLLQRLGNPWANGQAERSTTGQLLQAVQVCRQPAARAARSVDSLFGARWLGMHARLWANSMQERENELRLYLVAAWRLPRWKPIGEGQSTPRGADQFHSWWSHRRIVMHESEAEVMDCPLVRARVDYLEWCEAEGYLRILDEEDETPLEVAQRHAAGDAEFRAAMAARGGQHG